MSLLLKMSLLCNQITRERIVRELREDIQWRYGAQISSIRQLKCIIKGHEWITEPQSPGYQIFIGRKAPELRCRHCNKVFPFAAPSLACYLFGHKFREEECNCCRCPHVDPKRHQLAGCQCTRCKRKIAVSEDQHDWGVVCGGHCRVCGTRRAVPESQHQWDGCICIRCQLKREVPESQHTWHKCACIKCHQPRAGYVDMRMLDKHDWGEWESIRGVRQLGDTLTASRNCRRCGCRQTNDGRIFER